MPENDPLRLRFHHNVIEHLGLRLYDNKADKVICELVSNSWDADAQRVLIELDKNTAPQYVVVTDDGLGMDRSTLQRAFLTIAAPRRTGQNAVAKSPGGRPVMGRKGIGKLAPFGICRTVDVLTGSMASGFHWISLNLDAIQKVAPSAGSDEAGNYSPSEFVSGVSLNDLAKVDRFPDLRDKFVSVARVRGQGTAVIMTDLNKRVKLSGENFRRALGVRFTVTLARSDFVVTVDGVPIEEAEVLPAFDFRIPGEGFATDDIGGREIRYWVGFTPKPVSRINDGGIGVYAHGKVAQERPFWFNITGNDIYTPYVFGVVEADWLDEFAEDIISTDRTSIDWEHPQASLLMSWGEKNLRRWISQFQTFRQSRDQGENKRTVEAGIAEGRLPQLTRAEQTSLVGLLSEVSPRLPPDNDTRETMVSALADAWLHKPAREMIKVLWEKLKNDDASAGGFLTTVEALREYLVPEALSASVTFAQRAFALTVLYELVHLGKEPDLQALIENFPWIVGPEFEYLTANQTLRTVAQQADETGHFVRSSDRSPVVDTIKPDFVFLSDVTEKTIVVVELKSPQHELTLENREQLFSYLTFLEAKYPEADLRGILIGNAPNGFKKQREDVEIRPWSKVFLLARSAYTTILGSMLSGYADNPNDVRIKEVHSFGGDQVWAMLENIAAKDDELKRLLSTHQRLLAAPPGDTG